MWANYILFLLTSYNIWKLADSKQSHGNNEKGAILNTAQITEKLW